MYRERLHDWIYTDDTWISEFVYFLISFYCFSCPCLLLSSFQNDQMSWSATFNNNWTCFIQIRVQSWVKAPLLLLTSLPPKAKTSTGIFPPTELWYWSWARPHFAPALSVPTTVSSASSMKRKPVSTRAKNRFSQKQVEGSDQQPVKILRVQFVSPLLDKIHHFNWNNTLDDGPLHATKPLHLLRSPFWSP